MKKTLWLFILLSLANTTLATELSLKTTVNEIWTGYENGQILFKTGGTHINPANCSSNSFYVVDESKADANKFLSVLLSAQSRKATVQVRISTTDCSYGYPIALRMSIYP